jgi:hypothetical protein
MTNQIEELKEKIATMQHNLKVLEKLEAQKTDIERAYRDAYGRYPETSGFAMSDWDAVSWDAFQKGYEASKNNSEDISRVLIEGDNAYIMGVKYQRVEEPTKPMNEVMDRLENKYKDAEENAASYMTDEVIDRMVKKWETDPPSFLRFQLGKTLEALITRWWDDVYDGIHQDWDREVAIDDLVDRIQLWLPKEQDSSGTQDVSVIDLVDGYNDALTKIKSKLRNKK